MSERDALLRHVIEHADDDAPRLVMADWFDEHGEPERAEFIRLQVAIAQEDIADADEPMPRITTATMPAIGRSTMHRERTGRMQTLYTQHASAWTMGVAGWARSRVDFSRGFISHLTSVTASRWLTGAPALHEANPVTHVHLTDATGHLADIAAKPQLAQVRSLTLELGGISANEGEAFAASPYLGQLRSLVLIDAIGSRSRLGLAPILGTPWPNLGRLALVGFQLGDAEMDRLSANPALGSVVQLDLECWDTTPDAVSRLAHSPHLRRVVGLSLSATIGIEDVRELIRSPMLPSLRQLKVGASQCSSADLESLASEPALSRLNRLSLSTHSGSDAGLLALLDSPHLLNLRSLELHVVGYRENATWLALARSPRLESLQRLRLLATFTPFARTLFQERFGDRVELFGGTMP